MFEAEPHLTGSPDILADLTPAELERVTRAAVAIAFGAGDAIFRQGDPHEGIFVVKAGVVRSYYVGPNGREITLGHWGPGNFVGGPDLFGDGPHVWSGVAITAGNALRLPGPALRRLTQEIPALALGLAHGLAFKGKCYSALLQMLGTRSVTERLALVLVNLAKSRGIRSDGRVVIAPAPTHEAMAAAVGATRQWISASLERFRQAHLIEAGARRLTILDETTLRAIADGGDAG